MWVCIRLKFEYTVQLDGTENMDMALDEEFHCPALDFIRNLTVEWARESLKLLAACVLDVAPYLLFPFSQLRLSLASYFTFTIQAERKFP